MTEVKLENLKDLIKCQESPCVSIYMSTKAVHKGEFKKLKISFKNLLQEVEEKLKANWNFKQRYIDKFLQDASALAVNNNFWQEQKEGLAVFISPDRFEYFKLAVDTYDHSHVSFDFNLKQLNAEFQANQKYYILALSPNYNQLYQASRNNIEKIEANNMPTNIKDYLNLDDKAAEKQQSISAAGGSTVFHGQGGAPDDDNQDLIRYLKEVDRIINLELKEENCHLVIAADDSVFALYKNINSYNKLLEENLSGNAKQMNKKELKNKSWAIFEKHLHDDLKEVKERYLELKASDKTSDSLEAIVESAYQGKVDTLLLNKEMGKSGVFIEDKNQVKLIDNDIDYDLYNFAAVQTIKNGGSVYSLLKEEMPADKNIIALYRY